MFWLILVLRKRLNVTFERVRFLRLFIFSQNHKYLEAVARGSSVKKVFLEISQNSQKNTCARVLFLIKLQASFLLKRGSGTGVFL